MKIFTGANISYQSDIAYECNINFPRRKQSRLCQLSSNQSPKAMSLRFLLNIYFGFFMYIINWARYISPCIQVFLKDLLKLNIFLYMCLFQFSTVRSPNQYSFCCFAVPTKNRHIFSVYFRAQQI